MHQSYEATATCLTSLELRPCMRSGRCASAPPSRTRSSRHSVIPGRSSVSLLNSVSSVTASSTDRPRGPVHPLYRAPCVTHARTPTPQRGGSLPGLEARQALHRASKHATDPLAAGWGPYLAHPCGAGCAHTIVLLASQPEESCLQSPKNCLIRLCQTEGSASSTQSKPASLGRP